MVESTCIDHLNPYGLDAPYHIAMVDLTYAGLPGQLEQLWLNRLDDRRFRIACIPFCCFGLAYLDEVVLDSAETFVRGVVATSGNRVLRALIHEGADVGKVDLDVVGKSLLDASRNLELGTELHGDRFLAVDVPPRREFQQLVDMMDFWVGQGVLNYEWSDTRKFAFSRDSGQGFEDH